MNSSCRNCDGYVLWGWFCVYCVRAATVSFASGVGAALAAWLWRTS